MTHSASSIPDNPQGKPYVDFLVLLPLEDELLEFTRHFPSVNNVSTEIAWRHFVDPGDTGYRILAAQCISSGRIQAVNALQDAYLKYDIGVVVCIGIAGGLSTDLRLGDVCYTGTVTDVFDNAKASDNSEGITFAFVPTIFSTDQQLCIAFNFVRTQPEISEWYHDWQTLNLTFALELCGDTLPGRGRIKEKIELPRTLEHRTLRLNREGIPSRRKP